VALVGTRVWRIFCIVSHWKSPKNGPANDDHAGAVPALTDMCFTWQKDSQHVWSRVLWLIALAPAGFIGLILAAGYLPRVSTLVSVKFCCPAATAHFFGNNPNMSTWSITVGPMISQAATAAESYAPQCYNPSRPPTTRSPVMRAAALRMSANKYHRP